MEFSITKKIKDRLDQAEAKLKEIADKKADFEKQKEEFEQKKKDLEDFEKKSAEEIADAKKDVDSKIEQLVVEEKKRFELEEQMHIRSRETTPLEEVVEEAQGTRPANRPVNYTDAVDSVLGRNPTFYDITNYNVTNRLEQLAGTARQRPLTEKEREFVEIVSYHAQSLSQDDYYKDKQGANYLRQQLAQIDFINHMAKKDQERKYDV
jgi:hypothetical protein